MATESSPSLVSDQGHAACKGGHGSDVVYRAVLLDYAVLCCAMLCDVVLCCVVLWMTGKSGVELSKLRCGCPSARVEDGALCVAQLLFCQSECGV